MTLKKELKFYQEKYGQMSESDLRKEIQTKAESLASTLARQQAVRKLVSRKGELLDSRITKNPGGASSEYRQAVKGLTSSRLILRSGEL